MDSHIELFNTSYYRAVISTKKRVEFFERFYEIFMSSSVEVTEKFKQTDMDVQKKILMNSINIIERYYIEQEPDLYLKKLGQLHDRNHLDIKPDYYDLWLKALIRTLNEYDPEVNEEIKCAWKRVLTPGIEFMKAMY